MSLMANAADRLLGAIVPRMSAAAWSCPPGCHRKTCFCSAGTSGAYWFDSCVNDNGASCTGCRQTVWTC